MINFSMKAKILILVIINLMTVFQRSIKSELVIILLISFFYLLEKKQRLIFRGLVIYSLLFSLVFLLGHINNLFVGFLVFNLIAMKKVFPIIFFASAMIQTSHFGEFLYVLSSFSLPKNFIIMLSIVFRFFPSFYQELKNNRMAFKLRAYKLSGIKNYLTYFIYFSVVPLMRRAELVSDELAQVAILRGIESDEPRTSMFESAFSACDLLAVSMFAGLFIYEVISI